MLRKVIAKKTLILFILAIGTFLRFYRIQENLVFNGEVGLDYLKIKDFVESGKLPLFGPQTSHPWFSIAPLFYWIFMLILPFGNFQPVVGAYFFAGIGVLGILICYKTLSKLLDRKAGLITSYLMAISPSWLSYTRASRYNFVATILFFPFIYFLVKSFEDKGKSLLGLGLTLGLMFNFFPSPFVLIPVALLIIFQKRKMIKRKYFWHGLGAFLLINTPYIIGIIEDRFVMLMKIIQWIPYRILGFFGLYSKNTLTSAILKANFFSLYDFFKESFIVNDYLFSILLFIYVILFLFLKFTQKKDKEKPFWRILIITFTLGYLGLFLHGDPPKHYYFVIFPVPIIVLGSLFADIAKSKAGMIISAVILLFITYKNFNYFFSDKWFYIPQDRVQDGKLPVPYNLQVKIVDFIKNDAKGKMLSLKRVGELDHFNSDFAQNYLYLLELEEIKTVSDSNLVYTIFEDIEKIPSDTEGDITWISNIAVLREISY